MITFVRNYGVGLLVAGMVLLAIVAVMKTEYKTMTGTVIDKTLGEDKYGNIHPQIIIKADDGEIDKQRGLNVCQFKIGDKVTYKIVRNKDLF